MDNSCSSRRNLLNCAAGAGVMASLPKLGVAAKRDGTSTPRLPIVYFSKHLQWLDWEHMAGTAKELGFDGLDVTVRKGGHESPRQQAVERQRNKRS